MIPFIYVNALCSEQYSIIESLSFLNLQVYCFLKELSASMYLFNFQKRDEFLKHHKERF